MTIQGLNIPMQLASTSEVVEVRAAADAALGFETSSVGGMLNAQQVLDLPLPRRDTLSLVHTQAGLLGDNFGGSRRGALNITLDGVNIQDQRLNQGVSSQITSRGFRLVSLRDGPRTTRLATTPRRRWRPLTKVPGARRKRRTG